MLNSDETRFPLFEYRDWKSSISNNGNPKAKNWNLTLFRLQVLFLKHYCLNPCHILEIICLIRQLRREFKLNDYFRSKFSQINLWIPGQNASFQSWLESKRYHCRQLAALVGFEFLLCTWFLAFHSYIYSMSMCLFFKVVLQNCR